MTILILPSARKHGITDEQIRYVISHCGLPFVGSPPDGTEGPVRNWFFGDDARGVALEVFSVESGDERRVIHAMRLRRKYRHHYEEAFPWRTIP